MLKNETASAPPLATRGAAQVGSPKKIDHSAPVRGDGRFQQLLHPTVPSVGGRAAPMDELPPRAFAVMDRVPEKDGELWPSGAIAEGPGPPFAFARSGLPASAPSCREAAFAALAPVDQLFARLVTAAAVGGDSRRGSIRLELGGRALGRGQLTIHAEGDAVEIELAAPHGVDVAELETRVTRQLARKGVRVTRFDVR